MAESDGGVDALGTGADHDDLGLLVHDVIVAAQVQKPVNDEQRHFLLEGVAELGALTRRDVGRDDDVAQFVDRAARPVGGGDVVVDVVAFEGEHVGGSFHAAEALVQLGHGRIVHKADGDLRVDGLPLALEHEQGQVANGKGGEVFLAMSVGDEDFHGLSCLSRRALVGGHDGRHQRVAHDVFAGKIAEPLSQIDKITIIGGGNGSDDGVGNVAGNVPVVMAKLFESMKEATGVDLAEIMKADTYDAKVTRNINLNGAEDALKQVIAADTAPADKPVAENGATADTSSATVNS